MLRQVAASARAWGARTLAGGALALVAGCGESGGPPGGGGAGAAGGGGGGGAPVEGCVDIRADERVLGEPGVWGPTADMARQPFWVDERGVHFVWTVREMASSRGYLVVTSFDRETGTVTANRLYEAFPQDVAASMTGLYDAAGSPDGAFAAIVDHQDLTNPDGVLMKVVLGHVDEPALVAEWISPWSVLNTLPYELGWDGEAFAIHAKRNGETTVVLVRLAPDGTVLTPETVVGAITTFWPDESAFVTDAESGKSWMVTRTFPDTWLSGHERDGTPFPGTEADGGVLLGFYVDWGLGLATASERALVAGSGSSDTRMQPLTGIEPSGELVVLPFDDEFRGHRTALAADGAGWWMGLLEARTGIHSYHLGPGGEVLAKSPLIPYTTCSESCFGELLNVYLFSTARYQDELWFGFVDDTEDYSQSGIERSNPFHIVKVKDGCTYLTEYETNHPPN